MIIQLDKNTRIVGTPMCWELQSPRKSRGRIEWRPYKYFPTLGEAVRRAADDEIRTAPAEGIAEALRAADAVLAKYTAIFDSAAVEMGKRAESKLRKVAS
jgi:hypothetical protein